MINIKKFISENSEIRYAEFCRKFVTTKFPIVGVRIPKLKKFANQIEPEYIDFDTNLTHEEILLYSYSASQFKNEDEQLEYLQNILPYIDNWCTCDCTISALKYCKGQKSYNFFMALLNSNQPFYIRVGVVGLMHYFIKSENLETILFALREIHSENYYVNMSIAWFYAELCITNFALGLKEISKISNKFIRNKAISKARESYRVPAENKEQL